MSISNGITIQPPNIEVSSGNTVFRFRTNKTILNTIKWKLFCTVFPFKYKWID